MVGGKAGKGGKRYISHQEDLALMALDNNTSFRKDAGAYGFGFS